MNTYSKALRHISMKGVKQKHQQKLIEQKIQEEKKKEEEEYVSSVMEEKKYDWRKEIEVVKDQVEEVVEDLVDKEYDWREQLEKDKNKYFEEGMTSSGTFFTTLPATGDIDITSLSGGDSNIYSSLGQGDSYAAYGQLPSTRIANNGTGSGINGGFNIETNYLSFDGKDNSTTRVATLNPIDTSLVDSISITGLRGNNSNGGVTPVSDLTLVYYNIDTGSIGEITLMNASGPTSLTKQTFSLPREAQGKNIRFYLYDITSDGPGLDGKQFIGKYLPVSGIDNFALTSTFANALDFYINVPFDQMIDRDPDSIQPSWYSMGFYFWYNILSSTIGWGGDVEGPPGPVTGGTKYWSVASDPPAGYMTPADYIYIGKLIHQAFSGSATYGISNISFQRRSPLNVFVSLDSPEATSFIRTDPIMSNLSPQERLQKLKDMLEASDEYVMKMLGLDFPGTGAVPPGEYDTFKEAPPGEAGDTPGIEVTDYQNKLAAYEKALAADKQKSDELSKAVAAARAAYLKSGQTVAGRQQSYNKLQAAIKAGTDHALSSLRNPITKPTPPATQTSQSKFTPQQLADIDKQIKDLRAQSEKNKQDAAYKMNMARLNAVIGGAAVGAMGGIIGGAAISALGAGGAASAARVATKTGPSAARGFAKANPGKYNPFLSQQANKYFNLKNSYEPQGEVISEKRKLKSPQEVLNKIPGYYDGKPSPLGFPVEPPPKMVNGMHPDLVDGKKVADRFNRLDPESAKAMPPTGNPHIDKKVKAAAKKPK